MASKERIQRQKEETRGKILASARQIVKDEGWQALSLRKIADAIDYTAPIIYEYFTNKEAILLELTKEGFAMLYRQLAEARQLHRQPAEQLEAMWLAYWNFAFAEKEYYQVMYGVGVNCCGAGATLDKHESPFELFDEVIRGVLPAPDPPEDVLCRWYCTLWSMVHGLVSININRIDVRTTDEMNQQILRNVIGGIIQSMRG